MMLFRTKGPTNHFQTKHSIQAVKRSGLCKFLFHLSLSKKMSKKKLKSILTIDFSTSLTKHLEKIFLKMISEFIKFVFKSKISIRTDFFETSIYCTSKGAGKNTSLNKLLSMLCIYVFI